jgi:uncharacterized Zn finger protein (UPF0148 family)
LLRCPYCGSTKVIRDDKNGYFVCAVCGAVIKEIYEDDIKNHVLVDISKESKKLKENAEVHTQTKIFKANLATIISSDDQYEQPEDKRAKLKVLNLLMDLAPRNLLVNVILRRAIIKYIVTRAQGYPHKTALRKAASEAGVSMRSLEKVIKKYRPLLWYITLRVLNELREAR